MIENVIVLSTPTGTKSQTILDQNCYRCFKNLQVCEFQTVSDSLLLVRVIIMTYVRLILACILPMNERTFIN